MNEAGDDGDDEASDDDTVSVSINGVDASTSRMSPLTIQSLVL